MEHTNDVPLSLTGLNIWRGGNLSNGKVLFANGVPHLETGYSGLVIGAALQAELDAAGVIGVPFGNAVWYDRNLKASEPSRIYAGVPTAAGAVPKFAGILPYDAGIASGQPVANSGYQPHNKGKLIKHAYVRYKTGKNAAFAAVLKYADVNDATMMLFFQNATGDPVFAAPTGNGADGTPTLANCTFGGKIVMLYPEDQSILVEINVGA